VFEEEELELGFDEVGDRDWGWRDHCVGRGSSRGYSYVTGGRFGIGDSLCIGKSLEAGVDCAEL
jgi:hypothetical protein